MGLALSRRAIIAIHLLDQLRSITFTKLVATERKLFLLQITSYQPWRAWYRISSGLAYGL
jgi:hypothetical protein